MIWELLIMAAIQYTLLFPGSMFVVERSSFQKKIDSTIDPVSEPHCEG